MIAELFLVVHYAEVVVVASAEQAFRHDLIVAFSTFHNPNGSPAGLESIVRDTSAFDECKSGLESLVEHF